MTTSVSDDTAIETTLDALGIGMSVAIGAVVGLLVALGIGVVLGIVGRRHPGVTVFHRRIRGAVRLLLAVVGAWIAFYWTTRLPADSQVPGWRGLAQHGLLIAVIISVTWLVAATLRVLEDLALRTVRLQAEGDELTTHARRIQTQAVMLRRVGVVVVWVVGLAVVLLTFPEARAAGTSMLASAGILSVVAGLAAQSTLANLFAGMQLAFTDAIRVDDIVIVQEEFGYIEEITLTYVVVRVWDDRRIIVPSSHFAANPFENWSRQEPKMLGTFLIDADWRVPIPALRAELDRVLAGSQLWDGRNGILQVYDARGGFITLRVLLSAKDPGTLTDLQYYVREQLVDWLQVHAPYALPRTRYEQSEAPPLDAVPTPNPELSAELAEELAELASLDVGAKAPTQEVAAETPSTRAERELRRQREQAQRRARRRATRDDRRRARLGPGGIGRGEDVARHDDTVSETQVISSASLAAIIGEPGNAPRIADEDDLAALDGVEPAQDAGTTTGPTGRAQAGATSTGAETPADAGEDEDWAHAPTSDGADADWAVPDADAEADEDSPDEAAPDGDDERAQARAIVAEVLAAEGPARTSLLKRFGLLPLPVEDTQPTGYESALFSGSPENEERNAAFSGPSEQELAERAQRTERRRGTTDEFDVVTGEIPAADGPAGEPDGDAHLDEGDAPDDDHRARGPHGPVLQAPNDGHTAVFDARDLPPDGRA
ncbi:Membrane protein [Actinomycetales bacterium JB111]|nr:Membrane protein [Actinomycetales bacterium JB111]